MWTPRSLARACAAHPWRTVAAWLVVLVAAGACIGAFLGGALGNEADLTNHPESERAWDVQAEHGFFFGEEPHEFVTVRSERYTVDDPAFGAFVSDWVGRAAVTGAISNEEQWYSTHDRSLVSRDRHATLILATPGFNGGFPRLVDAVERADRAPAFAVAMTGAGTLDRDFDALSQHDLKRGELLYGLPAALVILLLVFGSVVAALVPIALALVAILVALALTALIGTHWELSTFVVNMISGMGLALGIDYALFVLSRFREERARGLEKLDAVEAAGATASRAVLFSGTAYVIALSGLLLVPSTVMRSLAIGAILVAIGAVAAALTLLPAIIGIAGDRVDALRLPYIGAAMTRSAGREGRLWGRVVARVMRAPVATLTVSVAILVALAIPVLQLETGSNGVSTLPDRLMSKRGFDALARDFGGRGTTDAFVAVEGDISDRRVNEATARIRTQIDGAHAFGPARVGTADDRQLTVLRFSVAGDDAGTKAKNAVRELRGSIPGAVGDAPVETFVGGDAAEEIDYTDTMDAWLPIVIGFVLVLSLALMTFAFRSIVVAAKAIVLNLLSVGAAYGLLVLVFVQGVGADLLGFEHVDSIEPWVPPMLFSILFGLSMDYHVFLISRIKERYDQTGDNDGAVAYGVASTARIITGAAAIIVAVFIGFAAGDLVQFQQIGFGVAVSLAIDATLIRLVLLPAAMKLLGDWNWYLPRWLEWLPRVVAE